MGGSVDDTNGRTHVVQSIVDAFNAHDPNRYGEFLSEDYILYNPTFLAGQLKGRNANLEDVRRDLAAFPDALFKTDRIFGNNEWVIVEGSFSGTNTGALVLLNGKSVRGTGRRVEFRKAVLHRVVGGKIVETHEYYDQSRIEAQLGFRRRSGSRNAIYGIAGLVLTTLTGLISLFHIDVIPEPYLFGAFVSSIYLILVSVYYSKKLSGYGVNG